MKKLKNSDEFLNEARSITKISKELADITSKMKDLATEYYDIRSQGDQVDRIEAIKDELRDLTPKKKALLAELDKSVSGKDRNIELDIKESNNEDELTEAKFNRLPRGLDAIQDLKNSVRHMSDRYDKGYDYSPVEMKSIESNIKDIKKAVKAFSNADDVKGTEYEVLESTINEGVTVFEKDLETMIKEIKQGYGWIDPEYAMHTWEAISNSVPFDLVKFEIYKQLISAKLLAIASEDNEEEAGKYIKSIKELGKIFPSLGIKESVVTESNDTIEEGTADFMARFKKTNIILKKGYDHLSDEELNKVYTEVGELVTDNNLKVKEVNVVFESEVSEARTIQTKRRYTESHPASSVGKTAKIRNKILEAIKDGRMTQSEFDRVVKEMSSDHKRWMKRNSNLFNVSEDGISLSGFGQKILKGITVNEIVVTESFESFSNSLNDTKE